MGTATSFRWGRRTELTKCVNGMTPGEMLSRWSSLVHDATLRAQLAPENIDDHIRSKSKMSWKSDYIALWSLKTEQSLVAAEALKMLHLPKSLFKHRTVTELSVDAFEQGCIWLAEPASCNDPYECQLTYSPGDVVDGVVARMPNSQLRASFAVLAGMPDERIEALKASGAFEGAMRGVFVEHFKQLGIQVDDRLEVEIQKMYRTLLTKHVEQVRNGFVFCSFSTRSDSMLMWSHYSDQHKGFCLEYGVEDIRNIPFLRNAILPVEYHDHMVDMTDQMIEQVASNAPVNILNVGLRKATDWSYEDEWRLIFPRTSMHPQLWEMPKVRRVLLGARFDPNETPLHQRFIDICRAQEIPVERMGLDHRSYRMQPEGLTERP
jgi:hypothetical protein